MFGPYLGQLNQVSIYSGDLRKSFGYFGHGNQASYDHDTKLYFHALHLPFANYQRKQRKMAF